MAKFDPYLSLESPGWRAGGGRGVAKVQSKERIKFCSVAIVFEPKGPNTYNLKIWLQPSGNHVRFLD